MRAGPSSFATAEFANLAQAMQVSEQAGKDIKPYEAEASADNLSNIPRLPLESSSYISFKRLLPRIKLS